MPLRRALCTAEVASELVVMGAMIAVSTRRLVPSLKIDAKATYFTWCSQNQQADCGSALGLSLKFVRF